MHVLVELIKGWKGGNV